MPSIELVWIAARALLLVLAFAGFAWAFSRWRKAAERDTQRIFEQLDLILGELREVSAQVQTAGENSAQPAEATHTAARFAIPAAAGPRGYEVAVRLAKNGASREELMSSCGISRHEAELLLRLHGAKHGDAESQKQVDTKTDAPPRARLSVVG
jgi:hypothetical protein